MSFIPPGSPVVREGAAPDLPACENPALNFGATLRSLVSLLGKHTFS